jgi:hypothetical protein
MPGLVNVRDLLMQVQLAARMKHTREYKFIRMHSQEMINYV